MAHELAGKREPASADQSAEESTDGSGNVRLNRREYVRLGAAASVVMVGGMADMVGASSESSGPMETYTTDFEEYAV